MSTEKQITGAVREGLKRKVEEHNEKVGNVASKRTNLRTLSAVFRRGVGAYRTNPSSVRPNVRGPEQWAYARVNAFLYALRNGRFRSGNFDTDLLPKGHPLSTKAVEKASYKPTRGMIASARRGLAMRREFGRGGTPVGVARARDIVNGRELSASTVLRCTRSSADMLLMPKRRASDQGNRDIRAPGGLPTNCGEGTAASLGVNE